MRVNPIYVVLIMAAVIIVVIIIQRHGGLEMFGQDASVRASAGWIAGPKGLYGYDPIDEFAKQIEEMKARERRADPRLVLMSNYPNLEDSPTKDIGPYEGYQGQSPQTAKEPMCMSCMTTEEIDALN